MKQFTRGFLLLLALLFTATVMAEEVKQGTPKDTNWAMLQAKVDVKELTHDQAMAIAEAIGKDNHDAQALNKAGEFEKAAALTPFAHAQVWYELNKLRALLGGVRDASGHWSKYNVTCKKLADTEDGEGTFECHFAGSEVVKAACIAQAKKVLEVGAKALKTGLAPEGNLNPANAVNAAQDYLDTILK